MITCGGVVMEGISGRKLLIEQSFYLNEIEFC